MSAATHCVIVETLIMVGGKNYYLLESTKPALPLQEWAPRATNLFAANGSLKLTNKPFHPD
ncbi:hypothetical protein [Pedosphaera parvula]|uniref:Uncharacterized protein n=1 Tax=Pedosphaera parvula (strain Ellin514) TaxID=320771 RepID=B9XEY2_PEDPL|nr:hypothetical protein [Pedosphaera parvula]EEF61480.1 hypothetical protein Cflav_PD4158 [Pedosphaera parvula Ellin514]